MKEGFRSISPSLSVGTYSLVMTSSFSSEVPPSTPAFRAGGGIAITTADH